MIDTGARRGEICGLHWEDIDFQTGTVTIRRNLQYTTEKGVYETSPKNGKSRVVKIDAGTLNLLWRLRREQAGGGIICQYVFAQEGTAAPMFPQSPTRYFKKFGEKYGIANFHPHALRHTWASIAITEGADVVSVSERLGHSAASVTLRMYAHANQESMDKAGRTFMDAVHGEQTQEKQA